MAVDRRTGCYGVNLLWNIWVPNPGSYLRDGKGLLNIEAAISCSAHIVQNSIVMHSVQNVRLQLPSFLALIWTKNVCEARSHLSVSQMRLEREREPTKIVRKPRHTPARAPLNRKKDLTPFQVVISHKGRVKNTERRQRKEERWRTAQRGGWGGWVPANVNHRWRVTMIFDDDFADDVDDDGDGGWRWRRWASPSSPCVSVMKGDWGS